MIHRLGGPLLVDLCSSRATKGVLAVHLDGFHGAGRKVAYPRVRALAGAEPTCKGIVHTCSPETEMSNMMCAIRAGCFTDYFLSPDTVIRIMEAIAATETDAGREMLTVEAGRLFSFLALADDKAIQRVRAWGVNLADSPDTELDDTAENFLSWFHNMQAIRDSGELDEFTSHGYITFEFS